MYCEDICGHSFVLSFIIRSFNNAALKIKMKNTKDRRVSSSDDLVQVSVVVVS